MKNITPTIAHLKMLSSLRGEQWMIREDKVAGFALGALDASDRMDARKEDSWLSDYYPMRTAAYVDRDGIAHIDVKGALMHDCPAIYEKIGIATRYKTIVSEISGLLRTGARGVLLHVNSPGGTVSGNIEASEFIRDLSVPCVAFCDGLACSAAYKIAAGTNGIIATKSAEIGNIGTIMSWMDCSEFWAENGIQFKAIVSEGADLKSTGHLEPNETQLQFLQDSVNDAGRIFRNHVSEGRTNAGAELNEEVWRAGWYDGDMALDLGLADGLGNEADAIGYLKGFIK